MNFTQVSTLIELISNFISIIASGIAIYLFFTKKDEFKLLFKALINYSYQTTLNEIKGKLERLNEYNASEPSEIPEILNICHEIAGQIKGNPKLQKLAPSLAHKIESTLKKKISEPIKRSLVSEVREVLKSLDVDNFEDYLK